MTNKEKLLKEIDTLSLNLKELEWWKDSEQQAILNEIAMKLMDLFEFIPEEKDRQLLWNKYMH